MATNTVIKEKYTNYYMRGINVCIPRFVLEQKML